MENKVYTCKELAENHIFTDDYQFMDEAGYYTGELIMKAEATGNMLRVFFLLDDGRRIISPVFWWQRYLGFREMPVGTKLRLTYTVSSKNRVTRTAAEPLPLAA